MKKLKEINKNFTKSNQKGITLIALIVTIIVLIIIAGISIATLTADNGVLRQTNLAKIAQIEGTAREQVKLATSAMRLAVAEARAQDNSYSAIAHSSDIQAKLLDMIKNDNTGLKKEGWGTEAEVNDNVETFTITYAGADYRQACNNDQATITYTIKLGQSAIEITNEVNATLKDQNQNDVEIDIGGNDNTGGGSGVNPDLPAGGEVNAETGEILDSWEVIINNVNNGTYAAKYAVGNYKPLDIGEQGVVNMQIVAFDTDVLSDDTGKARITWIAKELLPTKHKMNTSFTKTGGWAESEMRDYLQTEVWALIPTDIQNAIVAVDKTYYDKTTNSTLSCEDKVWIPSCREIFGTTEISGVHYMQFFANRPPRRKTINGIIQAWWLRSADVEYSTGFYSVNSNGDSYFDYAYSENGIALSFCF